MPFAPTKTNRAAFNRALDLAEERRAARAADSACALLSNTIAPDDDGIIAAGTGTGSGMTTIIPTGAAGSGSGGSGGGGDSKMTDITQRVGHITLTPEQNQQLIMHPILQAKFDEINRETGIGACIHHAYSLQFLGCCDDVMRCDVM